MNYYHIIDLASNTTRHASCLSENGVQVVFRYYCSDRHKWKRLGKEEAAVLSEHGINIGVVYQNAQIHSYNFTFEKGLWAGNDAQNYASDVIGQPSGSAIYFAVDYNASEEDLNNNVIPFFKGVKEAFGEGGYEIGVYGSGLVINKLYENGLAKYRWLSSSTSYHGTRQAINEGEYEMRQFSRGGHTICGLNVDFDSTLNSGTEIGTFILE